MAPHNYINVSKKTLRKLNKNRLRVSLCPGRYLQRNKHNNEEREICHKISIHFPKSCEGTKFSLLLWSWSLPGNFYWTSSNFSFPRPKKTKMLPFDMEKTRNWNWTAFRREPLNVIIDRSKDKGLESYRLTGIKLYLHSIPTDIKG